MDYRIIAGTELNVSRICMGTMTFGDQVDEKAAREALACAAEYGVNFIDTANIYPRIQPAAAETILGKILKPYRQQMIIATKAGGAMGAGPAERGLGKKQLQKAVADSLSRLQLEQIDLYYAHFPDDQVSAEKLVENMNELITQGKIRYYGVSNFSAWQLCELILKAQEMGLKPPVATESVYNLLTRGIENELLPFLRHYPAGLIAFNPLAGGMLSGKYDENNWPADSRFALDPGYARRYFSDQNLLAVSMLKELAASRGESVLQLSLQWLYAQPEVTSIILGFSKTSQLKENLESLSQPLSSPLPKDELRQIWDMLSGNRFCYHK